MVTNYLFYLFTLPKEEQIKQILMLVIFFLLLSIICILLDFLKSKFSNKHKKEQ